MTKKITNREFFDELAKISELAASELRKVDGVKIINRICGCEFGKGEIVIHFEVLGEENGPNN